MAAKHPLRLVLLWHMHQPDFRDLASGEFAHPWVYLHAIKDYADMAAHLENHPRVHAVVNLVPILLDQLEDYCDQFASGKLRDPLLRLLAHENLDRITELGPRLQRGSGRPCRAGRHQRGGAGRRAVRRAEAVRRGRARRRQLVGVAARPWAAVKAMVCVHQEGSAHWVRK